MSLSCRCLLEERDGDLSGLVEGRRMNAVAGKHSEFIGFLLERCVEMLCYVEEDQT